MGDMSGSFGGDLIEVVESGKNYPVESFNHKLNKLNAINVLKIAGQQIIKYLYNIAKIIKETHSQQVTLGI